MKLLVNERRRGVNPIPSVPGRYINVDQFHSVKILREFGWRIVCIRRRTETPAVVILMNHHDSSFGIIDGDGMLSLSSDIKIRDRHKLVEKHKNKYQA